MIVTSKIVPLYFRSFMIIHIAKIEKRLSCVCTRAHAQWIAKVPSIYWGVRAYYIVDKGVGASALSQFVRHNAVT